MAALNDVTLEIDGFGKNTVVSGTQAEAQELYLLLNMVPGDCADDPDKGLDMRQYRVGLAESNGPAFKSAIDDQVGKYCSFQLSDIEVTFSNGNLVLGIQTSSSSDIILFTANSDNILTNIISS